MNSILKGVLLSIAVALLVTLSTQSKAQTTEDAQKYFTEKHWLERMQDPDVDFYELQRYFNKYWEGKTPGKGVGYKQFRRWEYINEFRVDASGKRRFTSAEVLQEFSKYQSSVRSASGNWSLVGPSSYPANNTGQPTGVGRINAIAFHPTDANTIFVGAPSGGIWKSVDAGESWTNLSANLPSLGVSSILIHPTNPDIIYIGTGDRDSDDALPYGVYKSTDGGNSWFSANNTMGDVTVGAMVMHPTNPDIIIAATSGGIYRSTDGGLSWTARLAPGNFKEVKINPSNPDVVYALYYSSNFGARFYRSADNGSNWTHITNGILNAGTADAGARMVMAVSPASASVVYLLQIKSSDETLQGILKSTDNGVTFATVATGPNLLGYACDGADGASQAMYDLCMTADPVNINNVFVGGINNWRSTDGGANWNISSHWIGSAFGTNCASSVHADQHCYAWSPHDGRLYVGHDGGISYTADGGVTWIEITNNLAINQIYKLGQGSNHVNWTLTGQQDNGSAATINGNSFTTTRGGDGAECIIDYANPDYCYNTYVNGAISRSTTGPLGSYSGITNTGNGIDEPGAWLTPYFLHKTIPSTMIAGYRNVWRTTNVRASAAGSVLWEKISAGETNTCRVLEQSQANTDIIYVVRSGSLKRTDNANSAAASVVWSVCTLPGGLTPVDIKTHSTNENIVFAVAGTQVFRSADKGANWTDITSNLPILNNNCLVIDKNANEGIYLGNQTGVWYKNADMIDWILFSSGLPPVDIRELEIFYDPVGSAHRIKAGTYGRGLWQSDLYESGVLNPVDFSAEAVSDNQINLEWNLNSSGNSVILAYNTSPVFGAPENGNVYTSGTEISGGGEVIFNGSATEFNHSSLSSPLTYYYKIWSYDGNLTYSTGTTVNAYIASSSADFTHSSSISCTGTLTVSFTDLSEGAYNSWAWDVNNDGVVDYTTQNPTHTFSSPGLYSVKLTVNNGASQLLKENIILVMSSQITSNTGCNISSTGNLNNAFGIGIFRFSLSQVDNITSNNDGNYQVYTCDKWTTLKTNTQYSVTIKTGNTNNEGAALYIDYNDNGTFEAGERVLEFPSTTGERALSFTTPVSGLVTDNGIRMRILSKFSGIPSNACDVGTYGQAEDYTVYFSEDVWTGVSDSDWHAAANWSSGFVPVSGTDVVIPSGLLHFPEIANTADCKNLTIHAGASLNLGAGAQFTVAGNLSNNAGVNGLVLESDVSGTASLKHSTAGVHATVQRYIAASDWNDWEDGWHFLSSPVAAQAISPAFTAVPADEYDFYSWYEPGNSWVNFKNTSEPPTWNSVNGGENFNTGKGYLVSYKNTGTRDFAGILHHNDVSVSGLTTSSGANFGWHLLGNPYTSALVWDNTWTKTNIGGVINIWNETAKSYTPLVADDASVIPSGNGFMVAVTQSPGSIIIPASKRVHSSQAWYKNSNYPVIRLFAQSVDKSSYQESQLRFDPFSTHGFDAEKDGAFLGGYAPVFYSVSGDRQLMVNSLPFDTELQVPFVFSGNGGSNYEIRAEVTGSLPEQAMLLDRKTSARINISQLGSYRFASAYGDDLQRFVLYFSALGMGDADAIAAPEVWYSNGALHIHTAPEVNIVELTLLNTSGQVVKNFSKADINSGSLNINCQSGIYLVRIKTLSGVLTRKVIII